MYLDPQIYSIDNIDLQHQGPHATVTGESFWSWSRSCLLFSSFLAISGSMVPPNGSVIFESVWSVPWRNTAVKKYTTYYPQNYKSCCSRFALDCSRFALGCSRFSIASEVLFEVPELLFEVPGLLLRVLHSNALGCSRFALGCSRFALGYHGVN